MEHRRRLLYALSVHELALLDPPPARAAHARGHAAVLLQEERHLRAQGRARHCHRVGAHQAEQRLEVQRRRLLALALRDQARCGMRQARARGAPTRARAARAGSGRPARTAA